MNETFEPPNKASIRHLWAGFAAFCFLILLAIVVFKIQSPWFGSILTMVGTAIIIFQNRPIIWREGDTIIFRYPSKKTTTTKPAGTQVSMVVEWTGYEGTLYDIVWKDGDTWTIAGKHWVSLKHIVSELKNCGMAEVPSRKDLLVFRPQSSPLLPVS